MHHDFGIVIACFPGDAHFAQASYMSIRHFLGPDIPICFVVDGDPQCLGRVLTHAGVSTLCKNTISNQWLRDNSFGWGLTKMVAFYEAPFERFLYLDADALVWGNVLSYDDSAADMVTDRQHSYTDSEINFWFFNTQKVEKLFGDFDWKSYRDKYFCTGTYFSRKGIFPLAEYQNLLGHMRSDPQLFAFGEMGLLNFMIFRAAQHKNLWVTSKNYQVIPIDHSDTQLTDNYSPTVVGSPVKRAAVMHFCGKKAHTFTTSPKVAVMNYFRKRYLTEVEELTATQANLRMARQDILFVLFPYCKRGLRKIKRIGTGLQKKLLGSE